MAIIEKPPLSVRLSSVSLCTAITALFTLAIRIPVAPTRGYLHLGDSAIYFTALTLGPRTALLSGGLGTALADALGGFPLWAPLSLIAHGAQGGLVGLIAPPRKRGQKRGLRLTVAAISGTVVMVLFYFLGGTLLVGPAAALVEIPLNLLQNLAGIILGIALSSAISRAYPPVLRLFW